MLAFSDDNMRNYFQSNSKLFQVLSKSKLDNCHNLSSNRCKLNNKNIYNKINIFRLENLPLEVQKCIFFRYIIIGIRILVHHVYRDSHFHCWLIKEVPHIFLLLIKNRIWPKKKRKVVIVIRSSVQIKVCFTTPLAYDNINIT